MTIALSMTEAESFGITLPGVPTPKTTCRVFEDNVGALDERDNPYVDTLKILVLSSY